MATPVRGLGRCLHPPLASAHRAAEALPHRETGGCYQPAYGAASPSATHELSAASAPNRPFDL